MDERFYKRFARALHIFFSFTFFGRIDISGKETEEVDVLSALRRCVAALLSIVKFTTLTGYAQHTRTV